MRYLIAYHSPFRLPLLYGMPMGQNGKYFFGTIITYFLYSAIYKILGKQAFHDDPSSFCILHFLLSPSCRYKKWPSIIIVTKLYINIKSPYHQKYSLSGSLNLKIV